jgi:uncharacterized protein
MTIGKRGVHLMNFKEITIADKGIFDEYFTCNHMNASEFTFTNFFMWRKEHRYQYSILDGSLVLISFPRSGEPYAFFPLAKGKMEEGVLNNILILLQEYFIKLDRQLVFKKVTEDQVKFLKACKDFLWEVAFDRDHSDYVYKTQDLISLSGKKYDGKRNHINKFKSLYTFAFIEMNSSHKEECKRIHDEWCKAIETSNPQDFLSEKNASQELLDHFEELNVKGCLIRVNDRFEAYSIAEQLNTETTVIHIEKGNFLFPGIYQVINQQFCENVWSHTPYINREQDLGIEGLRKAKESYHPEFLVKKYIVRHP